MSEPLERWKMSQLDVRQRFDEYLDGTMDAGSQRALEAAVAADPVQARLLTRMKSERALRAAAYDSYIPSATESRILAAQVMSEAYAPVGRVGAWSQVRRWATVAAAVAVLIGTFAAGRITASASNSNTDGTKQAIYRVVYMDRDGVRSLSGDIESEDDMKAYIAALKNEGATIVQADYADLIVAGNM